MNRGIEKERKRERDREREEIGETKREQRSGGRQKVEMRQKDTQTDSKKVREKREQIKGNHKTTMGELNIMLDRHIWLLLACIGAMVLER